MPALVDILLAVSSSSSSSNYEVIIKTFSLNSPPSLLCSSSYSHGLLQTSFFFLAGLSHVLVFFLLAVPVSLFPNTVITFFAIQHCNPVGIPVSFLILTCFFFQGMPPLEDIPAKWNGKTNWVPKLDEDEDSDDSAWKIWRGLRTSRGRTKQYSYILL
jgi:hypothetical protein